MEFGTSYFGVRDVRHVRTDLDRFERAGLNAILHTFSERDAAFYQGTMADIVAESNDRGFTTYVNPWGVGQVFGGEALSAFLGKHPEARQQVVTGQRVPAACFNNPDFREHMREWTRDAAALGPDALFWDEPHWYVPEWFDDDIPDDAWVCRCTHCRTRFEAQHGEPMPAREDERVRRFREDSLLDFLDEMMAIAHEPDVENAVCLVPVSDEDHGIADWSRLGASDHLDTISTDPYWGLFGDDATTLVTESVERVVDLADEYDLESQIWVQGFELPATDETVENVRMTTERSVEGGVDSVFLWGYDGCRSISSIACEDPELVWNTYLDAVAEYR